MMKNPVHPGEILREDVLAEIGLSVSEAASRLGMQAAYDLATEREATLDPSIKLLRIEHLQEAGQTNCGR